MAGIVLAGVVAVGGSIILTALFGVVPMPTALLPAGSGLLQPLVMSFLWINILWGLINRMTVFPLDGGNVARRLLIKTDPMDGARKSLWISAVAGALLMAAGFFLFGSIFI